MANYKTPGVYVEEISKFPPSVAQVETAIPAFIGYTEKAEKLNGDSLHLKPTRITSLLDYETYFGQAANETSISVDINDVTDSDGELVSRSIKVQQPTSKQPYLMYYSMQMYFANGGGPCYITSVGQYESKTHTDGRAATGVVPSELIEGLDEIEREDEPTLLLFPDATEMDGALSDTDFYSVFNAALAQSLKLQDRFTLIDLRSAENVSTPVDSFRNEISNEGNLRKYGAAYFPYLETILDYQYAENDILINHTSTVPRAVPEALLSIQGLESDASTAVDELLDITDPEAYSGLFKEVIDFTYDLNGTTGFGYISDSDPLGDSTVATCKTFAGAQLESLVEKLGELIEIKDKVEADANSVIASVEDDDDSADDATRAALANLLADFEGTDKIEEAHAALVELIPTMKKAKSGEVAALVHEMITTVEKIVAYTFGSGVPTEYDAPSPYLIQNVVTNIDAIEAAVQIASDNKVDTNNGAMNGRVLGTIEDIDNATYNKIKLEISALSMTLPPAAAMAGIYARIDSTRGVWKAPANVSLSYVIKPTLQISHDEQADLNVHTTGKSINAIRTFTGKGTLVWGARTLAGNDNEWRYINVRRFFNMVEESVGKATEQFVFEGNDASTWVRVRAMIENFLNLQWKAGALAGAKAEQAYYVRVGLGQTMTAQDILEGRMIVEIGMAAVRPAEFIILRFSHKMQEA